MSYYSRKLQTNSRKLVWPQNTQRNMENKDSKNNRHSQQSRNPKHQTNTSKSVNFSSRNNHPVDSQRQSVRQSSYFTRPSLSSRFSSSPSSSSSSYNKPIQILPSAHYNEKSHVKLQQEVDTSTPPNLNLSTYGYSVNAKHTARQKSLYDAIKSEGVTAVKNRIRYLIDKYDDQSQVVKTLLDDYNWIEKYNNQMETKKRLDHQRDKSRERLLSRMQQKSRKDSHRWSGVR
jgi:hypothetical protein